MPALNKQQALARRRKQDYALGNYGALPGERTAGLPPGARFYDADTNTYQLKEDYPITDYIDQVMAASGGKDVQGSSQGNEGTGSGEGGKSTEASDSEDAVEADTESLDTDGDDFGLMELLMGGAGGAAMGAYLASRKKKGGSTDLPRTGEASDASYPAEDTAGEADRGGASSRAVIDVDGPRYGDGSIEEILALPPPMKALPPPGPGVVEQDGNAVFENLMADNAMRQAFIDDSGISQMIGATTDDPTMGLNADMLRALGLRADVLRENGYDENFPIDALSKTDQGLPPQLMDALRRIMAKNVSGAL